MLLEVSCTAFCAAQLALHEAMRSPNASYSREPNAFLVAARSTCCLCRRCADPYHSDTSVPGTTYPVQHTAQHTRVCPVATWQLAVFPWLGKPRPASSFKVLNKTPCRRFLRALSWSTRASTCLYEAVMTSSIAPARCGCCTSMRLTSSYHSSDWSN